MKRICLSLGVIVATIVSFKEPEALAAETTNAPKHRSPGKMYSGMALTGLGGAAVLSGAGFCVYDAWFAPPETSGSITVFVGAPLIITGLILGGIGIPLWVSGARPPERSKPAITPTLGPKLSVGPRFVSLRYDF